MAGTTKNLIRTFFVALALSMVAAAQQAREAGQAMKEQQWEQARALYGNVTLYNGELQDGEMRFEGTSSSRGIPDASVRLTFTALPDGSVRQHGESKMKDGTEWVTTYDFIYRKKN